MRPNFDLAAAAVLYRIVTDPIVKSKNESPPKGELAILFQDGESTELVVGGGTDRPNRSHWFE
jgi:hypothetical protein